MRIVRLAFALFAVSAAGCAVDAADPDLAADAPNLSESWTVSSSATNTAWNSGLVANLASGAIHCNLDYGGGYMLTDFSVNEEPIADPAEFIASMNGICREFDLPALALPRTGNFAYANIFSAASYSPGLHWTHVPAIDSYPIGIQLRVNGASTHVKDVRVVYAHKDATGLALDVAAPLYTPWAIGYAGTIQSLSCPAQHVLTGLDLDYVTAAGQIRFLEIHCREMVWP
ncbi:hypothetical protein WME89_28885 [Sorangium sp. So ce321]|uniref:hypothetical protein n=1 Tax=Sorangium sp. So ce321 TaxID=3133300 RepID=UPI003F5DEB65